MLRERIIEWQGALGARARPVDADQEVVRAFLAGDERAFDHLFERYHSYVYNICLGITGRPEDAQDLTQETFLRVHRSLRSFRGEARFSTWLYRIAVNCAIEHLRRPACEFAASDLLDSDREPRGAEDVADTVLRTVEDQQVHAVLARIHVPYRAVLTLHYLQGLSLEEIAQVLQCNVGAVKIRLHRARRAFRDSFLALERSDGERVPARR